jgi:hypothetical protein
MFAMKKNSLIRSIGTVSISVLLIAVSGQAIAAKGSGGGRTFDVSANAGTCLLANGTVDTLASTSMVLRSSQGINYFIMQTIGDNSVGTWEITFTKNGVQGTSSLFDFPPPGGWAVVGGQADKGAKSINAIGVARNIANGTVCTAQIARVF